MKKAIFFALLTLMIAGCSNRTEKDLSLETTEDVMKLAEQGNADAQCELGLRYQRGEGVERDFAEAVKWYKEAAEQGNTSAIKSIALSYFMGAGVPQSSKEAFRWFRKAAEQGDAISQYYVGMFYIIGREVEQNYSEAIKWLTKAAEQGNVNAQKELGMMYLNGKGVEKNKTESTKWLQKVTEQDTIKTSLAIGITNGHEWVDLGLSVKWAMYNVGASSPSDYGNYYAWGATETYSTYDADNCATFGKEIGNISGNPTYDVARSNWGGSWRVPTIDELAELVDECEWEWIVQDSHNGYQVTGPNGNSIFLPAAGWYLMSSLEYLGSMGYYISANPYESRKDRASTLRFDDSRFIIDWSGRALGQSVRPVIDK